MNPNLEDRIEHHLTPLIQEKFELLVKETGTNKLIIPKEYMALVRIFYQIGYQEGQKDTFNQIKDIYNNDVDCFIDMFETVLD